MGGAAGAAAADEAELSEIYGRLGRISAFTAEARAGVILLLWLSGGPAWWAKGDRVADWWPRRCCRLQGGGGGGPKNLPTPSWHGP